MKWIFNTLLVLIILNLAGCGETSEVQSLIKTSDKKIDIDIINPINKQKNGTYKIGVIGSNLTETLRGLELKTIVDRYSQDISRIVDGHLVTGVGFKKLPTNLRLQRSDDFNNDLHTMTLASAKMTSIVEIKKMINNVLILKTTKALTSNSDDAMFTYNSVNDFILTDLQAQKFYINLGAKKGKLKKIDVKKALIAVGFEFGNNYTNTNEKIIEDTKATKTNVTIKISENKNFQGENYIQYNKSYPEFYESAKINVAQGMAIFGPRKLDSSKAGYNLDTLFIQVEDGVHNSKNIYKNLVTKEYFEDTHIVMIGDKVQYHKGSSERAFANKKITTATYSEYLTAYIVGFQAAVGLLEFDFEENEYVETTAAVLIGSLDDNSKQQKFANAFRRGVEAALIHSEYSGKLKLTFINKKLGGEKSGEQKLIWSADEWRDEKLKTFLKTDEYREASRGLIYIAGATADHWQGEDIDGDGTENEKGEKGFIHEQAIVLSGSKYTTNNKYKNKHLVILDKYIKDAVKTTGANAFNRDGVRLLGTFSSKGLGIQNYAEVILKTRYIYNPELQPWMLGKHTLFGAPINAGNAAPTIAHYGLRRERYASAYDRAVAKELNEKLLIIDGGWLKAFKNK